MNELYEKAALAAYENCLALFDESKILAERSKFARAYALCVLASEEFVKSFLYKGVSAGLVKEQDVQKAVVSHLEKLDRFDHLMRIPYALAPYVDKINEVKKIDRTELDHSKHLYPILMGEIWSDTGKRAAEVNSIFSKAQQLKMKSLYVDVKGNTVIVPTETVGQKQFEQIFGFLNGGLRGFEAILKKTDEQFRTAAESVDPELRFILKPRN